LLIAARARTATTLAGPVAEKRKKTPWWKDNELKAVTKKRDALTDFLKQITSFLN
jgi:hypothetical protein